MRILNAEQHRRREQELIATSSSLKLMENAGAAVVEVIRRENLHANRDVVVCCGPGNNGGDGWVIAALLHEMTKGPSSVTVYSFGEKASLSEEASECRRGAEASGLTVREIVNESDVEMLPDNVKDRLIVDALFGSGLNRPITGVVANAVEWINQLRDRAAAVSAATKVVSVDIPSGLAGDSPSAIGPTVNADYTVALVSPRVAHVVRPAARHVGELTVHDFSGFSEETKKLVAGEADVLRWPDIGYGRDESPRIVLAECNSDDSLWTLFAQNPDTLNTHKGNFGRVTIVAGSRGKTGAAQLAGMGALRAGAGLVTIVGPESCREELSRIPECMTVGLPDRDGIVSGIGLDVLDEMQHDVIAVGPGLGVGSGPKALVEKIFGFTNVPLVLDADALTIVSRDGGLDLLKSAGSARPDITSPPVIVTPHPGEMSRLTRKTVEQVQANRLTVASEFAKKYSVYVVLKGDQAISATPYGHIGINTTGNTGMSTGGSGDVLTGVLAAFLGREVNIAEDGSIDRHASNWGELVQDVVYLHGYAGDLAAKKFGQRGLIASDIATCFGKAVCDHGGL